MAADQILDIPVQKWTMKKITAILKDTHEPNEPQLNQRLEKLIYNNRGKKPEYMQWFGKFLEDLAILTLDELVSFLGWDPINGTQPEERLAHRVNRSLQPAIRGETCGKAQAVTVKTTNAQKIVNVGSENSSTTESKTSRKNLEPQATEPRLYRSTQIDEAAQDMADFPKRKWTAINDASDEPKCKRKPMRSHLHPELIDVYTSTYRDQTASNRLKRPNEDGGATENDSEPNSKRARPRSQARAARNFSLPQISQRPGADPQGSKKREMGAGGGSTIKLRSETTSQQSEGHSQDDESTNAHHPTLGGKSVDLVNQLAYIPGFIERPDGAQRSGQQQKIFTSKIESQPEEELDSDSDSDSEGSLVFDPPTTGINMLTDHESASDEGEIKATSHRSQSKKARGGLHDERADCRSLCPDQKRTEKPKQGEDSGESNAAATVEDDRKVPGMDDGKHKPSYPASATENLTTPSAPQPVSELGKVTSVESDGSGFTEIIPNAEELDRRKAEQDEAHVDGKISDPDVQDK